MPPGCSRVHLLNKMRPARLLLSGRILSPTPQIALKRLRFAQNRFFQVRPGKDTPFQLATVSLIIQRANTPGQDPKNFSLFIFRFTLDNDFALVYTFQKEASPYGK